MTARILIVDDAAANARVLQSRLAAEYYQVATAQGGPEALGLAVAWQPDLILLDVMMPGMDGYETCRRLKADALTLHVPVVMISGLDEPAERLHGLACGADDFFTKPVEYALLLARVRSLVRLKRGLDEWRARGETARVLGLSREQAGEMPVHGARVLLVQDCAASAHAIQEALGQAGVLTGRARTEAEALSLTAAIPFDLIVLNLSAAEDALGLASKLRAAEPTQDVPVLLVVEPEQRTLLLRAFDLGANDWMLRPVDENELRIRACNQIRRKFYRDSLRADLGHALELALTDPLTDLHNQRFIMRHLRELLARDQKRCAAVLMVDVDHFKAVNDDYGHAAGDQALKLIADTLRSQMRALDTIARYGGEEFMVVMPATTLADAAIAAERLRVAVTGLLFYPRPGTPHPLTISVGVATSFGCMGKTEPVLAERLIQAADLALYQAKRAGRNRVETGPGASSAGSALTAAI